MNIVAEDKSGIPEVHAKSIGMVASTNTTFIFIRQVNPMCLSLLMDHPAGRLKK